MDQHIALHIGIDVRERLAVGRRLNAELQIDGDGWEAWGEAVGAAGNDGVTLHVVLTVDAHEAEGIIAELLDTLVPMDRSTVVALSTSTDDWDIAETGGRAWHRIRRVSGGPMLVTEYVPAADT